MRANEFLLELRDRMYQYIRSIVPTWPEYVVQDWLYKGRGKNKNYNTDSRAVKDEIIEMIADAGLSPNTNPWQLVPNMKFTMDMFQPLTQQRLIGRAGGTSDLGMGIPKDKERHATQAALIQKGGVSKEPAILIKTPQGYELLEGWHRTIQHFAKYPNGYVGPAYVAVAQSPQGVTEAFNQPYAFRWDPEYDRGPDPEDQYNALARLPDGTNLTVKFYRDPDVDGDEDWVVEFWRGNRVDISGAGDAQRVFATVLTAIGQFLEIAEPETLRFTADKDVEPGQKPMSRTNLYDRLVQRYAQAWGYRLDRSDMADTTVYLLHRIR